MDEFQKQSVVLALTEMFEGTHFNICTVDRCLTIAKSIPPADDYNALRALHCVDWNKMPPDFRQQVFVKTLGLFAHTGFAELEQDIVRVSVGKKLWALQ